MRSVVSSSTAGGHVGGVGVDGGVVSFSAFLALASSDLSLPAAFLLRSLLRALRDGLSRQSLFQCGPLQWLQSPNDASHGRPPRAPPFRGSVALR